MELTLTPASIEKFRDYLSARGKSSGTIHAYSADMSGIIDFQATNNPQASDSLSEDDAARYLNKLRKTVQPTTVRRKLASIRMFARSQGNSAFLKEYVPPKPAKPQPHPIEEGMEGFKKLVFVARNAQERALLTLTFLCGLRVTEARRVVLDDIDKFDGTLTVHGKGDKRRIVPLSERAYELLEERIIEISTDPNARWDSTPLVDVSDKTARRWITRMGVDAGLGRNISSHDGRATFATTVLNNTQNIRVVQELLGHASVAQTEVYTGVEMSAMKQAVNF